MYTDNIRASVTNWMSGQALTSLATIAEEGKKAFYLFLLITDPGKALAVLQLLQLEDGISCCEILVLMVIRVTPGH